MNAKLFIPLTIILVISKKGLTQNESDWTNATAAKIVSGPTADEKALGITITWMTIVVLAIIAAITAISCILSSIQRKKERRGFVVIKEPVEVDVVETHEVTPAEPIEP